jgi:hydroxymethylpyrimidine/phosphomethylpyrimidine kinase
VPSRLVHVLAIGGSDPSGGAGIQADLKTIHALGGYALTVVTSVTAQNSRGVAAARHLDPGDVDAQIRALDEDFAIAAVKTGMLATAGIVECVAQACARGRLAHVALVVDPVVAASDGTPLLDEAGLAAVKRLLLPRATLCTPNRAEAERLAGISIDDLDSTRRAAERICALGARAVLIKGGHAAGPEAVDLLLHEGQMRIFRAPRIEGPSPRGTGCTLASAIALALARGLAIDAAVAQGKAIVTRAIRTAVRIGQGAPFIEHARIADGPDDGRAGAPEREEDSGGMHA